MKTFLKLGLASALGSVGLVTASSAAACGGGGVTSVSGVVAGAQRVLMSVRSNGTTDVVAQVVVPETTASYGVVIPVPSEPTLDEAPVSAEDLNSLDALSAPTISVREGDDGGGIGCSCGAAGGDKSSGGSTDAVTVGMAVNIGPVVAVSLTGEDASAVGDWFTTNGFQVPSADLDTLAKYVGAGAYFIAIKRSETVASGGPSSIGVHYTLQGNHRKLSLGFTRIGAAHELTFTLFLAASQAAGPSAPFNALTIDDLDTGSLRLGNYQVAVRNAVAQNNSRAFVLESAKPAATFAGLSSIAALIDSDAVVTRATTVVARTALTDDAVFANAFYAPIPSFRQAGLIYPRASYASFGELSVLLALGMLRRRARNR
ncbi:MAG: DUF2330 domain-containing protein [Polyangiaceae bacterium]